MVASYLIYLENKSKNTKAAYESAVNNMLAFVNKSESEITIDDLNNWVKELNTHYSSGSVYQKIKAVQNYYKFLMAHNIVTNDPSYYIEAPKVYAKEKPYISEDMAKAIVANARNIRDKAIVMLMLSTGLRVGELVELKKSDYIEMKAAENNYLTIVAKGNKPHIIYFNQQVSEAIDLYLASRNDGCEYLFATAQNGQIHRNNLSQSIKTMAKNAGIPFWKDICNHSLRSACATIMNDKGVDLATIRDTLGHSSSSTTMRYIKTNNSRQAAVEGMIF